MVVHRLVHSCSMPNPSQMCCTSTGLHTRAHTHTHCSFIPRSNFWREVQPCFKDSNRAGTNDFLRSSRLQLLLGTSLLFYLSHAPFFLLSCYLEFAAYLSPPISSVAAEVLLMKEGPEFFLLSMFLYGSILARSSISLWNTFDGTGLKFSFKICFKIIVRHL